jgi:hypothetical protein
MKHHDPARPVGKCKGCCLNMRTYCAAGLLPKQEWSRGRCRHHNDRALLRRMATQPAPAGAKLARRQRKARAALDETTPHYNAVLDPAKLTGHVRRHRA